MLKWLVLAPYISIANAYLKKSVSGAKEQMNTQTSTASTRNLSQKRLYTYTKISTLSSDILICHKGNTEIKMFNWIVSYYNIVDKNRNFLSLKVHESVIWH